MDIYIDVMKIDDAAEFIEYFNKVGAESDNLSFGKEGMGISLEEEKKFLELFQKNEKNVMFVARHMGKIVGHIGLTNLPRRFSHRATIGITVLKTYWGNGIGTKLIENTIDYAKNIAKLSLISLEVRTDNDRAIKLYEKFGFEKIGRFEKFFKIDDEYFDAYIMTLNL